MKSVDPGILPQSHCSTFQPSEFARKNLIYMTWCGHYYCTGQYYMDREELSGSAASVRAKRRDGCQIQQQGVYHPQG